MSAAGARRAPSPVVDFPAAAMNSWTAKARALGYNKVGGSGLKMAPIHFYHGIPRRSRALVIVFFLLCALLLLPAPREHVGNALIFIFLSPQSSGRYGRPSGGDILRFVDPLIGTVNGGACDLSSPC